MSTAKTILVAGAVVGGAYVLYKLVVEPRTAAVRRPAPASTSLTSQIVGGVGAALPAIGHSIASLFGSSSPASPSSLTSYGSGTGNAPSLPDGFDTGNYTSTDNAGFTDSSGNFVLG